MSAAPRLRPRRRRKPQRRSGWKFRTLDLLRNILLLGGLWFLYTSVRGVTADEVGTAMANAGDLLAFEKALGLPSELAVQQLVLDNRDLLRLANVYYVAAHFPVTIAVLAWVWIRHNERFARVRAAMVAVTGAALVLHVVYPLAPPRMLGGFVDTARWLGPSPYDMRISKAANQIAAMPSLHVGWALLMAFAVIWIATSRWRWLALLHPVLTVAVVVVTANHYWVDAIIAALLVVAGWWIWGRARRHDFDDEEFEDDFDDVPTLTEAREMAGLSPR